MTSYITCIGCALRDKKCERREGICAWIKGIGITSLKFRCDLYTPHYSPGDAVWATTWDGETAALEYGEWSLAEFPATVIRQIGAKVLVYIPHGTKDREDDTIFQPTGTGFCKIKLSRLTKRDAPTETLCEFCSMPASLGHLNGYGCEGDKESGWTPWQDKPMSS